MKVAFLVKAAFRRHTHFLNELLNTLHHMLVELKRKRKAKTENLSGKVGRSIKPGGFLHWEEPRERTDEMSAVIHSGGSTPISPIFNPN